jgi:hypothetical protein
LSECTKNVFEERRQTDIYVGSSFTITIRLRQTGPYVSYEAGLPDGLFLNQKSKFGYILEGLGMENVSIFYDQLEYFMAIWHNLCQFGIVCGHLVYFYHFGIFGPRKIWQPWYEV